MRFFSSSLTEANVFHQISPEAVSQSEELKNLRTSDLCELELKVELWRLAFREKELDRESELYRMEAETQREVWVKELELSGSPALSGSSKFVSKCIRLIPSFSDKDADKYFVIFKRLRR